MILTTADYRGKLVEDIEIAVRGEVSLAMFLGKARN